MLQNLLNNEVLKQVLADSFGGVMYDVDNLGKYESTEVLAMWDALPPCEKECVDGDIKGAIEFLKGE